MATSRQIPDLVFSDASSCLDQIVACGESSILLNSVYEQKEGVDGLAWAKNTIGRETGRFTLYIRYSTHVIEHHFEGGKTTTSLHPVWNYLERGVDTLVPLLRGDWTGHEGADDIGNLFPVGPEPGQVGYKLFLASMPMGRTLPARMLSRFLADARARDLIKPKVYYDGVKALGAALNFGADGVIYNPHYGARYKEAITCQGRRILTNDREGLEKGHHALAAVGYAPEDLYKAPKAELVRFNILSARFAANYWGQELMPVGPKAQAGAAKKVTA